MKKIIVTLSLFLVALTVQANGVREDLEYTGEKARTSYAFGMTVGGDLKQAGLEINYAAFLDGLRSAMEDGQTIMDRDDALEIVQNAFESAMRKQAMELQAKEVLFLTENALNPDVVQIESGLQYIVLEEGTGPKPQATDTVRVHYEGALTNGDIFDSSFERDEPEEFPLDMVIPGWSEGIMLMNVGSIYRIFLPSSMAYGEHGAGSVIPPYSTLIFTVALLDIVNPDKTDSNGNSETEN
jgi:FKBP-type peptidyl-prolyl cis-trans isomerase